MREAEVGLLRLMGGERLEGKRFLDIGSGSGLHSLAALRLGAREVLAVDIDADSVATTRAVLPVLRLGVLTVSSDKAFSIATRPNGVLSMWCIPGACCTTPATSNVL